MMTKIDELEQISLHFVSENHEKSFQNVRRRSGSSIKILFHVKGLLHVELHPIC